ncbi:pentapeptide repeat-containing protein [Actinomadura parmotrematis]|uniref:Pentapeptide repeat-containing protein n=1 Tax=Actinomadura parmotrematis TaxID=2864039 RepID=A0ABS7FNS1_9ACTN|nr:pentapeptide repeat-containing protein [Actinomadura parmotrematis]MBW8482030.1 pentapeptide repeat-containing protein [Actinomadura parmotrematis]
MTPHEASRPPLTAMSWPRCTVAHGCTGRAAGPFDGCVAHLRPEQFQRLLAGLRPGADLDLRGVTVPPGPLAALLRAVTGPDGRPHLGRTRFEGALLPARTSLAGACFEGDASFDGAGSVGGISFFGAHFLGNVSFRGARFAGNASFHGARFTRHASFEEAVFGGDTLFGEAVWDAGAAFDRAVFMGAVTFDRASFARDAALRGACFGGALSFRRVQVGRHARFERARFRHDVRLGPLAAAERVELSGVTAHGALHVHAAAGDVSARGVTARGAGEFRLRGADLDLEGAAFGGPLTVRALAHPLSGVREPARPDRDAPPPVRVLSLRGVAAEGLTLADLDLSRCRFLSPVPAGPPAPAGLRLDGRCAFATVRSPWRRHGHAVLADDHRRRRAHDRSYDRRLAVLYRQLERAAAPSDGALARDFRYSALEMRRRGEAAPWRRWLLHALWLSCGYGLRAGRTLGWLSVIVALACCGAALAGHPAHRTTAHPRAARPSTVPWHER